jgi:hypothetical protein
MPDMREFPFERIAKAGRILLQLGNGRRMGFTLGCCAVFRPLSWHICFRCRLLALAHRWCDSLSMTRRPANSGASPWRPARINRAVAPHSRASPPTRCFRVSYQVREGSVAIAGGRARRGITRLCRGKKSRRRNIPDLTHVAAISVLNPPEAGIWPAGAAT